MLPCNAPLLGTSVTVVRGGGEVGGENIGEPKCVWFGGGDATWLGVVFPDAKNISEHGVPETDLFTFLHSLFTLMMVLPLVEDTEVIEKVDEAGLYTMASLVLGMTDGGDLIWGCSVLEVFLRTGTWKRIPEPRVGSSRWVLLPPESTCWDFLRIDPRSTRILPPMGQPTPDVEVAVLVLSSSAVGVAASLGTAALDGL